MTEKWPHVFIIGAGTTPRMDALRLALDVRHIAFVKFQTLNVKSVPCVEVAADGNVKKWMGKANQMGATHCVVMKDAGASALRDMASGEQREMPSAWIGDEFGRLMEERYL